MGLFSKKCGHESASPFKVRCSKPKGHTGSHGAKGLVWLADGKIEFGKGRGK